MEGTSEKRREEIERKTVVDSTPTGTDDVFR